MGRAATAAARSAARPATAPARRPPNRPARRRSGPSRAAPARPAARPAARRRATAQPRGAALLDRLLRGRAWVLCIGVLLVGVVFFNVSLLELNKGIAHTDERASALKQENARLRLRAARLASTERIQRAATKLGLVLPAPGKVRYLRADPRADARRAARTFTVPRRPSAPAPAPAQIQPSQVAVQTAPQPAPQAEPQPEPQAQLQQPQPAQAAPIPGDG
jgi:cell division protein FtsL